MPPVKSADKLSSTLPDPLLDAIWNALTTSQAHLALTHGHARRFPADIAPFAALAESTADALHDLGTLLQPGETTYLLGPQPPPTPHLHWQAVIPCLQMVFPTSTPLPVVPLPDPHTRPPVLYPLTCANSPEMLHLIDIAYPGYFRAHTCRMGRYFGARATDNTLIAMGAERLVAHPWREISGLCTPPSHPGHGLGTAILCHLLALHRAEGSRSWLWVVETNHRAIALYHRLGFQTVHCSELHRLQRSC